MHNAARKRWAFVGTFAIVASIVIAVPASAAASPWRSIIIRPPVASSTSSLALNCGWHQSCVYASDYPRGWAVDWGMAGGTDLYFSASFHSDRAQPQPGAATLKIRKVANGAGNCKEVWLDIYNNNLAGRERVFSVVYQHATTGQDGQEFDLDALWSRPGGFADPPIQIKVGKVASEENSDCDGTYWFGPHVHMKLCASGTPDYIGDGGQEPDPYTDADRAAYQAPKCVDPSYVNNARLIRNNYTGMIPYATWAGCDHDVQAGPGGGGACDAVYPGPRWGSEPTSLWVGGWYWKVTSVGSVIDLQPSEAPQPETIPYE